MMKQMLLGALVLLAPMESWAANCLATSTELAPSTYVRSAATLAAGLSAAAQVTPLSTTGVPSATGRIGLLLIGMSNAYQTGGQFGSAYTNDALRSPLVTFVNSGVSGHTADRWSSATDAYNSWANAAQRVTSANLTAPQIQWAHIVMTQATPLVYGAMTELQVRQIVDNLLARYPNVRGVWLSGIGYQGYSVSNLVLEPYAHNDSLVMASLAGTLPVWSDFLDQWSAGTTPNPRTGVAWACGDLLADGVHPSMTGRFRLALLQMDRWRVDPVMRWLWLP